MHSIQRFAFVLAAPVLAASLLLPGALFAQQSKPTHHLHLQPVPKAQAPVAAGNPTSLPESPTAQTQAPAQAQPSTPPGPKPTGPRAVFDTSMGRMVCRLYSKLAPKTVANFIGLAKGTKTWTNPATGKVEHGKPLYNGTIFHRVIPGFMIQGGDPLGTGRGGPGYKFNDEIVPSLTFDVAGRLAMANSGPNTNGSQFFITVAPQPHLDGSYTIFGQCTPKSVIVAESITEVPTNALNKPVDPVTLDKVTIVPPGRPLPPPPGAAAASTPAHSKPQR